MSAAQLNLVVADAATSTFNQVKQSAVQVVQWLGRQVQWLANAAKDFSKNVITYIRPFFSNVANFVMKNFDRSKAFVLANKEISIAAGVAIPVIVMATLAAFWLCGRNDQDESATQKFV